MLLRLAAGLQDAGVVSDVVNLGGYAPIVEEFAVRGVAVHSLDLFPTLSNAISGAYAVGRLIDSYRPDVVQSWMYHANMLALAGSFLSRHKPPLAWNIRRGLDDFSERGLKTRTVIRGNASMSRLPQQIIYCSDISRTQHEAFGFSCSKGCVLENGFDTERFSPSPAKREAFRSMFGISEDEFVIGNIGRYDLAKGHTYLLQAFGDAVRYVPHMRLILIGRGVDQANQSISKIMQRLGIADRVLLLGERESIEDVYPGFDLYCSASLNEGFPNALSEAMACGVPCVSTDTGASRQLVEGIGWVVPSRSSAELAVAITECAGLSKEKRQGLGMSSRERIVADYSLSSMLRQYHKIYNALAHG